MLDVVVVDDHSDMRQTLRAALEGHADFRVIGEAGDGMEAIRLSTQVRPDIILMDAQMPKMNGIESTRRILALLPDAVIIGMSSEQGDWVEEAFLAAGARGFLPKAAMGRHLQEVIQGSLSQETSRRRDRGHSRGSGRVDTP